MKNDHLWLRYKLRQLLYLLKRIVWLTYRLVIGGLAKGTSTEWPLCVKLFPVFILWALWIIYVNAVMRIPFVMDFLNVMIVLCLTPLGHTDFIKSTASLLWNKCYSYVGEYKVELPAEIFQCFIYIWQKKFYNWLTIN